MSLLIISPSKDHKSAERMVRTAALNGLNVHVYVTPMGHPTVATSKALYP